MRLTLGESGKFVEVTSKRTISALEEAGWKTVEDSEKRETPKRKPGRPKKSE